MSKLHAKDLMIGDWVCFGGDTEYTNPVQIDGISTEEACVDGDWYDVWEPIPLTAEILEKNGFEGNGYACLVIGDDISLQYYYHEHRLRKYFNGIDEWDNHREVKDITFQCHCYYVHELQHALKLCGMNKNIEL